MKILDIIAKIFFIAGLLLVCTLGTAPDTPFHMLGLPLCGMGAVMAGLVAGITRRAAPGGALPWVVLVFAGYFALRAVLSPVRHLAEMDLFLLAGLLSGFGMVWFSGRVRWLEPWLWVIAIGGAVVGVLQVTVDPQFTLVQGLGMKRPVEAARSSGFFFHPNPSGTWSAMLMMLAGCSCFFRRGNGLGRVFAGIACLASGVALLLSFCRASFLGAGLGFGVVVAAMMVAVLSWKASWRVKVGGAILVLALLIAGAFAASRWLPTLANARTNTGEVSDLANIQGRFRYWRTGMSQFLDAPVQGTGARTFSYLSFQHWDRSFQESDKDADWAHNEYIQALADYGFLGLTSVLALVVAATSRAIGQASKIARRDQTREGKAKLAWCLGALGAGWAFLGDVFFSFSGHFAPMVLLLGVMMGGLACIGSQAGIDREAAPRTFGASRWAVLAAVVVSAAFLCFPGWRYGWPTARVYLALSDYNKRRIPAKEYLGIAQEQADVMDRFPLYQHAAGFALDCARMLPHGDSVVVAAGGLQRIDKAMQAFPDSLEGRLVRAELLDFLGRHEEADKEFQRACEFGKKREYYYRARMRWGEAIQRRGVAAWNAGHIDEARKLMQQALLAYQESHKLAWVPKSDTRYHQGMQELENFIAFLKRTGEWGEEEVKPPPKSGK